MLRSELYQLEKFVGDVLKNEDTARKSSNHEQIADQVKSAKSLCADLKEKWVRQLFSSAKEHVLARYVHFNQAGITSLSNQISDRIPASYFQGIENQIHHLYYSIVSSLDELLAFLRQGFYKYFDSDYPVSIDSCRLAAGQINMLLAEIKIALRQSGIDTTLVNAVGLSITDKLTDAKQYGLSYRQLDYCISILEVVRQQARDHSNVSTTEVVQELYRQNFNSYHFNQWYQRHLSAIINAASENKREKIILREIQLLKLIFVERNKIFEPDLPPINEQLLPWLEQFLPPQIYNPNGLLKFNEHHRMPLQFSVTQFALFVRLCYLEGCFHINNISDIFRFFTLHFETKKQLNISLKSFAHAFYGADQATAAVVRDFLQRMINTINKIYFP